MNAKIPPQGYDELVLLAQDTRARRRRTNIGTTVAVAAAMVVSAGYVISTNEGSDSAGGGPADTSTGQPTIHFAPVITVNPPADNGDLLRVMIEQTGQPAATGAGTAGSTPASGTAGTPERQTTIFRELVWLVEGSRRIPMRVGDVAWIPEADRRIRLEAIEPEDLTAVVDRSEIDVTLELLPGTATALDTPVLGTVLLDGATPSDPMLPTMNDVGVARCIVFEQLGQSRRPGFEDGRYIDLDIRFVADRCPE